MCVCIIVDKHEGVQKDASPEYIKRGKYTSKAKKKKVLVR